MIGNRNTRSIGLVNRSFAGLVSQETARTSYLHPAF